VIHAIELPGIPLALAANQRAAVAAAINQRAHRAFAVAAEDDRTPGYRAGLEVTGIFDFGSVPDVYPAMVENGAILAHQHVVGDEYLAIDKKCLLLGIFDYEIVA
jgi:hypothetical protein